MYSTPPSTREMWIKAMMKYHPFQQLKEKVVITQNAGKDVEDLDLSHIAGGDVRWDSCYGK